jgi:L,D-transpeptidase ErfK/SrfK
MILIASAIAAAPAMGADFALAPAQTAVGELRQYVIQQGDVFPDIARRFDVGYTALVAANPGVDPWVPGVGRTITIPSIYILPDAPHQGIVLNLAQWRLYYFPPGGGRVETHPLGLGVTGKTTPIGTTRIVRKEPNPTWSPPPSIRAERPELPATVPPGPDNPLGAFALRLGWPSYLIHGTNKPDGVGRNVSHGCIRLLPEDIARLFAAVTVGTPVRTVDQPVTAGWIGDGLYVQVYPSKSQTEEIDIEQPVTPEPAQGVRGLVTAAVGAYGGGSVDWGAVDRAANERSGMPVRVAERTGLISQTTPSYAREAASSYPGDGTSSSDDQQVVQPLNSDESSEPSYDRQSYRPYDERRSIVRQRTGTRDSQGAAFQRLLDGLTNQ